MNAMANRQHLIPRSRGGSNHPDNVPMWDEEYHADWHKVFSNMTPSEQLAHVANLNASVLRKEFVELLSLLLSIEEQAIYQPQCIANLRKMQKGAHDSIAILLEISGVDLQEEEPSLVNRGNCENRCERQEGNTEAMQDY